MKFQPDQFRKKLMEAGLRKEALQQLKADKSDRKVAEANDKYRPVFLRPNDIDGQYDFKRALKTTLGGLELRDITLDDLSMFAQNIETIGAMYQGGITIPQIISLSRQDDIDRANKEIHTAIPTVRRAGVVTFLTNAGPRSKDTFHTVVVDFTAYDSVVLEPKKQRASTVQNRLANGKVKIECDCGRFKYWYRYIATLGNYVHGRKEMAFPKEKNPDMTGIACKHILRTVSYCKSAIGQQYLKSAIEKDRAKNYGRQYSSSAKAMANILDQQISEKGTARNLIKPRLNTEARKIAKKVESQSKKLAQSQAKLNEKERRIARLKANYKAGLIDKVDYEFYLKVESERKY